MSNWVELICDSFVECSLNATIEEGKIYYLVENEGQIEDYRDFNEALKAYIEIAHKKKNNMKQF